MTKTKTKYVCQQCGYESPQWLGRCNNCNSWSSFVEERSITVKTQFVRSAETEAVLLNEIEAKELTRFVTKIEEFDRVLGGGFVPGSVTLIGGDPGIGKSTIALQIASSLAKQNYPILYISGEESHQQLKIRAKRLEALDKDIFFLSATNVFEVEKQIKKLMTNLVIIDSVQTIYHPELPAAPGSVGQMREATAFLIKIAKEKNIALLLIGHVTKEGILAGPKVLEHMVDTVLYFEGENTQNFRILRSIKNRFGSTNEIGIFDMRTEGLVEIKNVSEVFLQQDSLKVPGSMVVSALEGSRSFLIEVQALVSRSYLSMPRRTFTGIDSNRAAIIIAVLEKKCGLALALEDIFINVVSGVRLEEPAADLGIALAIVSSFKEIGFNKKITAIGEIGLGGEIRTVANIEKRINEAEKLGFDSCIIPEGNFKSVQDKFKIELIAVKTLQEALTF